MNEKVSYETPLNPNIEVLERFAHAFSETSSLKKTHLHFASKTSWSSFDKYLQWLLIKKYVECIFDGREKQYKLTQNGRDLFYTVLKLKEQIRSQK